jgi:alanine-synthesizing transaminase
MRTMPAAKLAGLGFEIRGPVYAQARQLELAGHHIIKLNFGNPALYGFDAPEEILQDVIRNTRRAHGYSEGKGLHSARRAVYQHYEKRKFAGLDIEHIYLGNGVSELVSMALSALLNDGDEVLVPAPDYPLWTTSIRLCGGRPVHYRCDEHSGWLPDVAHLEAQVSDRTRAIVLINPNNPTGAVYPPEVLDAIAEVARRHRLIVFSDEIYDRIVYDGREYVSIATLAPDLFCLTFNGLSKAYRVAGFRAGWLVLSGPKAHAESYIAGIQLLLNMRLCANVLGQHAVQAALGGHPSIEDLVLPGGRLQDQRDRAWKLLNDIPGVSCVKPAGAIYAFPRIDTRRHPIDDDLTFVRGLLAQEKVLVVPGSGLSWAEPGHFRIVTLPRIADLEEAIHRIARYLATPR